MTASHNDLPEKIDASIDKAIDYLYHHQFPNGEFVSYIAPDEAMQEWCAPEGVNFLTGLIGLCLLPHQHLPIVDQILTNITNSLRYQMMRGGVWQHQTKAHRAYDYLAPDADDTAMISTLLKARNVPFPDNRGLMLCNRAGNGLFYTWFTLHGNFVKNSTAFWRLIARELKHPFKVLFYWAKGVHNRNDIDAVVNANVVSYLGHSEFTEPSIKYLSDLLVNDKEANSDKWYLNPLVYYYFIARLVPLKIEPIAAIKDLLIKKIKKAATESAAFQTCDMEVAITLSSLLRLGCKDSDTANYIEHLLFSQKDKGNWERYAFYTLPPKTLFWGSEELTTALCIEALHLYKEF
ncbi:hypothetical protein ABDK00_006865 [Niabella insulamsoli]|uniref:hypothetical protein n=1 Tax=Niabella insulamsoli TaxID=3144874 RepID=UPI0031FE1E91